MSGSNFNKVFAGILCAVITIYIVGYIGDNLVYEPPLDKDAVEIEGAQEAGAHGSHEAPQKPKLPDPIMGLLAQADIDRGAKISKACAACHSYDKGGPIKQGPNLWNVVNTPKAAVSGFSYSKDMKETGGVWDYDSLNKFLWKPKKFISGTKMNFAGLKKAEDRANLIAWLRTQADTMAPLPTPEDIEGEKEARQ